MSLKKKTNKLIVAGRRLPSKDHEEVRLIFRDMSLIEIPLDVDGPCCYVWEMLNDDLPEQAEDVLPKELAAKS